jgi:hypothetical protein
VQHRILIFFVVATCAVAGATVALAAGGKSNGSYEGRATNVGNKALDQVEISFKVKKGGSRVVGWRANLNAVCATFPSSVEYVVAPMSKMKVKSSGRFSKVYKGTVEGQRARIAVSGKLQGKRVRKGTFSYRVGPCSRGDGSEPIRWKAARVR